MKKRRMRIKTRAQEARQMAERAANALAAKEGRPLPFQSFWDFLDPTKVSRDATPEEIQRSYEEFCKLCPPRSRIEHTI